MRHDGNWRKRLLAGGVCLAMTGSLAGMASAAVRGDCNLDNALTDADALCLRDLLLRHTTDSETASLAAGDWNGDGETNGFDYGALKQALLSSVMPAGVQITLGGDTIVVESPNVTLNEAKNQATITASGDYYISGTLSDGQISVNIPDVVADPGTVKLFLDGVEMAGVNEAPLYVINAEKTSVNLVEGSVNTLTGGETYTETTGVIHAKDDLTIKGEGALQITAPTQYGIQCGNDLKVTGGAITVKTELEDGLRGKSSVEIKGGTLDVNAEGDGIKSTQGAVTIAGGNVSVKAGKDAIQAETDLLISDGTVIACGDRGLTGVGSVSITGGTVLATATDNNCETLKDVTVGAFLMDFATEWPKSTEIFIAFSDDTLSDKRGAYKLTSRKKFTYALMAGGGLADGQSCYFQMSDYIMEDNQGNGIFVAGLPAVYNGVKEAPRMPSIP